MNAAIELEQDFEFTRFVLEFYLVDILARGPDAFEGNRLHRTQLRECRL
jgi:hypothetical protein